VHTESPDSGWVDTLERFIRLGLLEQEVGRLRLSERGRDVADSVAEALI
jgi:coproporphyrinogen III oxidase-like Fe-S oxidoreductase